MQNIMKRLLLMMTASVLIFSACSEDDEATTYEQTEFYGTWELSNSTSADYIECPDNPPLLTISAVEISFPITRSDNGCNLASIEQEYTFNGSAFIYNQLDMDITYKITSKSENEFSWNDGIYNETETWIRVE